MPKGRGAGRSIHRKNAAISPALHSGIPKEGALAFPLRTQAMLSVRQILRATNSQRKTSSVMAEKWVRAGQLLGKF